MPHISHNMSEKETRSFEDSFVKDYNTILSPFFSKTPKRCLISDSYKKTIDSTIEEQFDTRQYKENKITLKRSLVVFFIRLFVVHRNLKNALK